jgi:predicted AlkP superfamily phosphohydrolase/phosphomutase
MSKMVVLGLSGFNPELVEGWLEDLPNLRRMQEEGIWGKMESTVPPNIPQAWTCAQSSRNPGVFGFWDFRYRDEFSYGELKTIDCRVKDQRVTALYKILPMCGQKIAVVNVPVTWPPPRIPGGYSISSFMTPDLEKGFTWPKSLADEVQDLVGEYIIDVFEAGENYLQMEKDRVLKRSYEMDAQRFTLLKHFIGKKQCDCIITVIMGTDRMAHFFYRYLDDQHRRYEPDSQYGNVLHDYYIWIDEQIGEIRDNLDEDTALFVHSDHCVQRLDGRINLNEWLIQEGYMVLSEYPSEPIPFMELKVDWSKTRAWATGYSGQIYFNMKGREPEGIIALETRAFKRNEIYTGIFADYAPDIFIFFDECRWKTNEMVGFGPGNIYSFETPFGEDDGADGSFGYFCLAGPGIPANGEHERASLLDIAPTVIDVMNLEIPKEGKNTRGKGSPCTEKIKIFGLLMFMLSM